MIIFLQSIPLIENIWVTLGQNQNVSSMGHDESTPIHSQVHGLPHGQGLMEKLKSLF